ncbi:MAG: glycosyltransferase family 2 protein [Chloroflexi bacterium]|nr:glycosyltransferase family 2 protein [Chloroflexota bacterium]
MSSSAVSIIIPNWNGANVLPRCLTALSAQTFTDYEAIVVDNASTDGSVDNLEAQWPNVQVIRLDRNLGFAAANNIGAHHARGRWLALLNNDAFPEPGWLAALVQATRTHPEFTFFASRLIQAEAPNLLDGAGDVYHITGLAWRRCYNIPVDQCGTQIEEVFSPCAAAALYPRDAFLEVGGFDEDFGSYHEDVDIGFRLRLRGHHCLYIPDAIVHHIGSASTGKQSDFSVYYGHRNLVWSYTQNMPGFLFWVYLPAHLYVTIIFLIHYSLRGQAKAIWKAKLHALTGLPAALRKRRIVQSHRQVHPTEISRVLEHTWLKPYLLNFRARLR